jgi:hypothetical protein
MFWHLVTVLVFGGGGRLVINPYLANVENMVSS